MERFFKRKLSRDDGTSFGVGSSNSALISQPSAPTFSASKEFVDLNSLPSDHALRKKISEYHPNQADDIRRYYLTKGPCQPRNHDFPQKMIGNKLRRFNRDWFNEHANWLEYSIAEDKAYCLCCYLFRDQINNKGLGVFISEGFSSWHKKDRLDAHVGGVNSAHFISLKKCEDLLRQDQSITVAFHKQSDIVKNENRIRLSASIDSCRFLLNQGLAFRGHDESEDSLNRGNFLEMIKVIAKQNDSIRSVVLGNAERKNCQMIAPSIQKEIVHCFAKEIVQKITEEFKDDYFSLMVDESSDVSGKEQMAVVLRFVDSYGNVKERFICVVHVKERFICGLIETGTGLNQELSLTRAGDTRWGSHFKSLANLSAMFSSVVEVVSCDAKDPSKKSQACGVLGYLQSFDFVFNLQLMLTILLITNELSLALQRKDTDILNAMTLVRLSRERLQATRKDGWESLLKKVIDFCNKNTIACLDMNDEYVNRHRPRRKTHITNDFHYRVECFYAIMDQQILEINDRFNEINSELLLCVASLNPSDRFADFSSSKLTRLAQFYPDDFSPVEFITLESQLETYIMDMRSDERFSQLKGLADLCLLLVKTRKNLSYPLIYQLLKFALILPVATASVEICFSAMNIVMTDLRSRICDQFLNDCLVCFIEKDLLRKVTDDDVIKRFQSKKTRRGQV